MEGQREFVFHDTVPLPEEQLGEARETAKKQKANVLELFRIYPNDNWTAYEVWSAVVWSPTVENMLITSVRRCITDLTKEGRLIKCQWSESRQGQYGTLNRTWKYNTEYVKPLNPQR